MPGVNEVEMDLRLFAQIHDDPFLTGAYDLQGEEFGRAIQYLFQYIDQHESPDAVKKLKSTLSYLAEIEKKMSPGKDAIQDPRKLLKLASAMINDLQSLPGGESIAIPGGWNNQSSPGHGMVYQFTRTEEGLTFAIYNAGSGSEYHEHRSAKDRELFFPIQLYAIPLPKGFDEDTKKRLSYFLRSLMIPRLPSLRKYTDDSFFDAKKLYEEVLTQIYFLDAKLISSDGKGLHTLTGGQLSGTCAVRCLHQMLKSNFSSLEAYQRFIYHFKRYALDDFMESLLRSGNPRQTTQKWALVKHAINTLKRTLNLAGLFEEDFIASEVEQLNDHLTLLQALKQEPALEKRLIPTAHVRDIDDNIKISPIADVLIPQKTSLLPSKYLPVEEVVPVTGGADLFIQLQILEAKIKRLMANRQYQTVIEGLEVFFINLPLSPNEKDFYQAINQENQTDFYQALNRLHGMYLNSIHSISKEAALPRMWAVSLSVVSVLDTVSQPLTFSRREDPTFQSLMAISSLSRHNLKNAYGATNKPMLDARIAEIQERYQSLFQSNHRYSADFNVSVIDYYKAILMSDPAINEQLRKAFVTRFAWKADPEFGNLLINRELQALYMLSIDYKRLKGSSVYKKFEAAFALEACALSAVKSLNLDMNVSKQPLKINHDGFLESHLMEIMHNGIFDTRILKHKYGFPSDSAAFHALDIDFNRHIDNTTNENSVQLMPSSYQQKGYLWAEDQRVLASHVIDRQEIMDRELFHLRGSRQNQIKLTLDYYLLNVDKLSDPIYQRYLEANLFQPGLLIEELKKGVDRMKHLDRLIKAGLRHFSKQGLLSEESLFFLRLSFMAHRYAAEYQPERYAIDLEHFQDQLTVYLQMAEKDQWEINRSLHQLRYQTAIARFKLKPSDPISLLRIALPSFFYMNAKGNPKHNNDLATDFDLECMRYALKKLVAANSEEQRVTVLQGVVTVLGLGTPVSIDKKSEEFYQISVDQEGRLSTFQLDMGKGLTFNDEGMAYTPVPLDIFNHPVMKALKITTLDFCIKSMDDLVYELGDPPVLRFIRLTPNGVWRVQKKWAIGGRAEWFELRAFNRPQQIQLGLEAPSLFIELPDSHQQRESHLWIGCENSDLILVTENNQPAFISNERSANSLKLRQLDSDAMETGFNLLSPRNTLWLYAFFEGFEDPRFITVCQNKGLLEISLDRYGLTFMAEEQQGQWIFYRKDDPSQRLMTEEMGLTRGVSWLVFEDEKTKQRKGYVPLQPFIGSKRPSPHSEFYQFIQDIKAEIPEEMVAKSAKGNVSQLLPWQYSDSEQWVCFPLNDEGKPFANTPEQALYLSYLYLGCHQPEQAWAILEDCAKRLGGLRGTLDELKLLSWIIGGLPKQINQPENEETISTPAYVACKLKALALLTQSATPDKIITVPEKTFDLQTPEGHYQHECWNQLQTFRNQLNQMIYKLYSTRFQQMQRHATHSFLLKDDEKKSLLEFYHHHLPGKELKALGSLGYEWQRLKLMDLKKEWDTLQAQKLTLKHLPEAYEKRLSEIDAFLSKEGIVRAHHTNLELRPIDLSIPPNVFFSLYRISYDDDLERSWSRISSGLPYMDDAVDLLTSDTTELEMVRDFPRFCKLAVSTETSANKTKLIDFCRRYLIAHHRVPLVKQPDQLGLLINLLYRMSQYPSEMMKKPMNSCYDFISRARELPDPIIEIYQPIDQTFEILANDGEIWKSLNDEIPSRSEPMRAPLTCELSDFSTIKLLEQCHLNVIPKDKLYRCFQQYQQAAKIFVEKPDREEMAIAKQQVLTKAELDAGKIQTDALLAMKQQAFHIFSDDELASALHTKVEEFIEKLEAIRQQQLSFILTLANAGPADPIQNRQRVLEIEGEVRAPLDEKRLLALYLQADKVRYRLATGLSDQQIDALHTCLSHFLAISVRQQSLVRFSNLKTSVAEKLDLVTCQQLAETLFTENLVNEQTEPVLNFFQYYEDLYLRPQQIAAIKRLIAEPKESLAYPELIEKIIMGGGKSKVILPLLASLKATGSNLMVIEVPQALFETNSTDLDQTSRRLFNQKGCRFEFNRDTDCSSTSLTLLHQQLMDVIANKDYLVTTGEAVQSLELKYFELLLTGPSDVATAAEWKQQVVCLDRLVSLFRTRADAVIDEVHQGLLLKKKLNYTLGSKRSIPMNLMNGCVDLYCFFDQVTLSHIFGEKSPIKTLGSLLENDKRISKDLPWNTIMEALAYPLVFKSNSPLQQVMEGINPPFTADEKHDLLLYIKNQGATIPACVQRCDVSARDMFALYKEQVSQLLTSTLSRKLHVDYGPSYRPSNDGLSAALAIPYAGNRIPLERSRFGNYLESMNLSIQMLMIDGFQPALLKTYLAHLQTIARQELLKNPSLGSLENTSIARGFASCTPSFHMCLGKIDLKNEQQFTEEVFNALRKNKTLMRDVLKTDILKEILIEEGVLHSDAFNHVDIYRSCQGITGTPTNSHTYHQRLRYKKHQAAATDGFIIQVLRDKKVKIRKVKYESIDELIARLFEGKQAKDTVRALIDICASFKGIRTIDVAKGLAHFIKKNPAQFSNPDPLKFILFFDDANKLCALDIQNIARVIPIGSTNPKEINEKLGCTPDQRFSYYDQSHTIGTDLKQSSKAQALVLVDHDTSLQSYLQGCMRMRGLADDQSIEVIVSNDEEPLSQEAMEEHFAENDDRQLKQDVFFAGQGKLINAIRAYLKQRVLDIEHEDVDKKHRYARASEGFLVEKAADNFFAIYGGMSSQRPAQAILLEQKQRLLTEWTKILQDIGEQETVIRADRGLLAGEMDSIIQETLQHAEETYLSPTGQELGLQVEVQKETMKEMQRELQQELQVHNPMLRACPYIDMFSTNVLQKNFRESKYFQTLTHLCAPSSAKPVLDFDDIYVGENYYRVYESQKQFIDIHLKPVHAILFRKRPDQRLESVILSPLDAEKISNLLTKTPNPHVWMSTTQHTILAGQPPQGIVESKPYQEMIEKIRFFNGELTLLTDGGVPLTWLGKETEAKLDYYEHHLLRSRATTFKDVTKLREALSSSLSIAYRYLADHPLDDYSNFDWRLHVHPLLSKEEVAECNHLAKAFAYATLHGLESDFCFERCQQEFPSLSFSSYAYLATFIDSQLSPLRDSLRGLGEALKKDVMPILPMLMTEYIPHSQDQSLVAFLLHKMSGVGVQPSLMNIIERLLKNAPFDPVEKWMTVLDNILDQNGHYAKAIVIWFFNAFVDPEMHEAYWQKASPEALLRFVQCPCLLENEFFIKAYLAVFGKFSSILEEFVQQCETHNQRHGLQKILDERSRQMVLLLNKLMEHPQVFVKSIASIEAWMRNPVAILLDDRWAIVSCLDQVIDENHADEAVFIQILAFDIASDTDLYLNKIVSSLKPNTFHLPCVELIPCLLAHPKITVKHIRDLMDYVLSVEPDQFVRVIQYFGLHQLRELNDHQLIQVLIRLPNQALENRELLDFMFYRLSRLENQTVDLRFAQFKDLPAPFIDRLLNHNVQANVFNEIVTCSAFNAELFDKLLTKLNGVISDDLVNAIGANRNCYSDSNFARHILQQLPENKRIVAILRFFERDGVSPAISVDIVQRYRNEMQLQDFMQVFNKHPDILNPALIIDILSTLEVRPKRPEDVDQLSDVLIKMLALPYSNNDILKKIVALALDYLPLHIPFWERIPVKYNTLDLSDINLTKKAVALAVDIRQVPPHITKLDLTHTQLGWSAKRAFMLSVPVSVREVADKQHQFLPRQAPTSCYTFLLRALDVLAAISGLLLLIAGGLLANPFFLGGGALILGSVAAAEGYHFFSNKNSTKKVKPVTDDLVLGTSVL